MKVITAVFLLILTIGTINAVDLESSEFIDLLIRMPGPGSPVIFQDAVIFSAPSSYRRMGISFAHENYSQVYWYQRLMLPEDPLIIAEGGKNPELYYDAGLMFHVQPILEGMQNMDYRVIIDGIWTFDPLNPVKITGAAGIIFSRAIIPYNPGIPPIQNQNYKNGVLFSFTGPPGELITIGGSFNNWDPFMYQLRETSPGLYTLNLALAPGTYQYVFFHRGERFLDPNNIQRTFTADGKSASELVLR